jgi:ABC-type phosphate transport system substrate-binding protein
MDRRWCRRPAAALQALVGLLLLLLLAAASAPSLPLLRVSAAVSAPEVAGSVNAVFLDLFREALLAYQLVEPAFTGVTLSSNSGDNGLAMAASGNFDWTVTTTSLPDKMRKVHPTLESYPIAMVGIAPAYNLPDSVGDSTLTLTTETMCRIWRGNITHWSVAMRRQRSGGRCTAGVRAIGQLAAARRMCMQC